MKMEVTHRWPDHAWERIKNKQKIGRRFVLEFEFLRVDKSSYLV